MSAVVRLRPHSSGWRTLFNNRSWKLGPKRSLPGTLDGDYISHCCGDRRKAAIWKSECWRALSVRYRVLAADYDGTLASGGVVDGSTLAALDRARSVGWDLVLATGRQLDDLRRVFPELGWFARVVAENGALLYSPATREERALAYAPSPQFVQALSARGVDPLAVGRVIVATREPHHATVLAVIGELALPYQVILNKGAVMALPLGVDKATGLRAALDELGISPRAAVAVGDAENDQALLELCGLGVAVANALPALKELADVVTRGGHGAGVVELIDHLIGATGQDDWRNSFCSRSR
jgi:hydroxymethylpyrimidine pyrophosphatase-like HAD family hydrolase